MSYPLRERIAVYSLQLMGERIGACSLQLITPGGIRSHREPPTIAFLSFSVQYKAFLFWGGKKEIKELMERLKKN